MCFAGTGYWTLADNAALQTSAEHNYKCDESGANCNSVEERRSPCREFWHFTDIPSPFLLKRLLKVEEGAEE